ncbi:MAG: hypothetical protein A2015_03490 [Spirochaetes bacterium GWF1_31_7]|nr:MAG: hypothetical protein A2Y30_07575 [Spirochaetes bacterium GWE1_32_154]OHD48443.1 MAG: hypothetical protein A2Y29_05450 [Spirochaetes bacterium GWE2_31_10]OHD50920.1 MAG: hypothetical protein A2015_03490 [Spirochaetes bacterium GWF1_31_7]OHD80510.1 MAG: hypothetical protein A2355_01600 [Spirochaetes bacterium RIFOXYB1_FULL_32_8]HBD92872.1 hypothetical protein [Spirochaetia bacterium]
MVYFTECPICSKNKIKNIYTNKWKKSGFNQCGFCKMIFQNPQESIDKTKQRYNHDYFQYEIQNEENFFNLVKKTIDDFDVLSLLDKGSSILEIGCATGLFLKYMDDCGHKSTGIEICKESAIYGISKYGVNIINKTLEEADLREGSFDFIHFSHLIEHLNNPKDFIEKIYKLLKPDGFIVITTPNSDGVFSKVFDEDWRCIVDDHLFLFNKKNLIHLLSKSGFIVDETITWGSIPSGKVHKVIKNMTDRLVKITGTGDVVSVLAYKNFHY